jgi:hypothetical protein
MPRSNPHFSHLSQDVREEVFERLHKALNDLARYIPSARQNPYWKTRVVNQFLRKWLYLIHVCKSKSCPFPATAFQFGRSFRLISTSGSRSVSRYDLLRRFSLFSSSLILTICLKTKQRDSSATNLGTCSCT